MIPGIQSSQIKLNNESDYLKKNMDEKKKIYPIKNYKIYLKDEIQTHFVKKTKAIVFHFDENSFPNKNYLPKFAKILRTSRGTQTLRIHPRVSELNLGPLTKEETNLFFAQIKKLKSLRNISFGFDAYYEWENQKLMPFYSALKALKNLENVNIRLNLSDEISNIMIKNYSYVFKRLFSLKKLSLSIEDPGEINDLNMQKLERALKKLVRLETFHFRFWCSESSDAHLQRLSHVFAALPVLKNLILWLYWCRTITDTRFRGLSHALQNCASLETLELELSVLERDQIRDFDWYDLSLALILQTSLQTVSLSFKLPISNAGIILLSQSLRNLPSLKNVHLVFQNCCQITSAVLQQLIEILSTFPSLKTCFFELTASWHLPQDQIVSFRLSLIQAFKALKKDVEVPDPYKNGFKFHH